jgi:small subunit ribosomal protein S16
MATVIRLQRGGRSHEPYYRVVVMDSRNRTRGRVIDDIGVYQPCARPEPIDEIDVAKALSWLSKGARPSDTVRAMLTKKGVMAQFASGAKAAEPGA